MVVEEHEAVARIGIIAEKRGASDGERADAYTATARQTADGVDHIQVKSVVRLQNYSVSVPGRGCRSIKSFGLGIRLHLSNIGGNTGKLYFRRRERTSGNKNVRARHDGIGRRLKRTEAVIDTCRWRDIDVRVNGKFIGPGMSRIVKSCEHTRNKIVRQSIKTDTVVSMNRAEDLRPGTEAYERIRRHGEIGEGRDSEPGDDRAPDTRISRGDARGNYLHESRA